MSDPSFADRYLDLLTECVNGSVYGAPTQLVEVEPVGAVKGAIAKAVARTGLALGRSETLSQSAVDHGVGWPAKRWNSGESMIGRVRLTQVREAVRTVLEEDVPGHFIETGVWKGGACIVARAAFEAYGSSGRRVYVADSFMGLPPADDSDDAANLHGDATLAISREDVAKAFERYGLLDDTVVFLEGWFSDTLPTVADQTWSIVRLDGDMYESTRDGIENLYPGLSSGGFLIVDDYHVYQSCRRAITEYRQEHGIDAPIVDIDQDGVYWRNPKPRMYVTWQTWTRDGGRNSLAVFAVRS